MKHVRASEKPITLNTLTVRRTGRARLFVSSSAVRVGFMAVDGGGERRTSIAKDNAVVQLNGAITSCVLRRVCTLNAYDAHSITNDGYV